MATDAAPRHPRLKSRGTTPLFVLPSTAGGTSGPGALRSKYNAVLAFVEAGQEGEEGEAFLSGLAGLYADILAAQARLLVVVPLSLPDASALVEKLSLPFPLLADPGAQTTQRMLGESKYAALCVTDRFGQIFSLETAGTISQLPPPQSALDWLEFVQIQCPE